MAYGSEVEKLERRWMENPLGVSFAPLAEAYRRAGEQPRALEVLAIGLANHPAYVPALIVQARCHLDVHADGAAEESFLAVLATDAHNLIALKGLADICERSGRPEKAVGHLDRLLEADPTHDEARTQLDRLAAVIAERGVLRGDEGPTREARESAAAAVESATPEPIGFEPTATGNIEDHAALEDITLTLDPVVETLPEEAREGAAGASLVEGDEPDGAETAAEGPEPIAGLEAVEPEFQVEKDVDPFEASAAVEDESRIGVDPSEDPSPVVPFEEELSSKWLEESSGDEGTVSGWEQASAEVGDEGDPEAERTEHLGDPAPIEADPVQEAPRAFWAPTGAPWIPVEPAPAVEDAASHSPDVPETESTAASDSYPESGSGTDPDLSVMPPVRGAESTSDAGADVEAVPSPWEQGASPSGEGPASVTSEDAAAEPNEILPGAETPAAEADASPRWETSADSDPESGVETEDLGQLPQQGDTPAVHPPAVLEDAEPEATEDDGPVVVEGAESELPSDAEPEIETALVMTATMARVFEKQGHHTMALAIYAQLAEQDPDDGALSEAVARLTEVLSPGSGGVPQSPALNAIVGRAPRPPAPDSLDVRQEGDSGLRLDAPATRASGDLFSLSAVFGSSRPAVESAIFTPGSETAEHEPSFDEFFEDDRSAAAGSAPADRAGEEDLEQFTAWLRSLKR